MDLKQRFAQSNLVTTVPEFDLLLRAAGKKVALQTRLDLCARIDDWDALIDAAEFHGLSSLLAAAVEQAGADAPQEIVSRLRDIRLDSVKRALFFFAELRTLTDAFSAANIPVISLKGPALAAALYPDPALRPCSDLDLLVREADIAPALDLLTETGYRLAPHLATFPAQTLATLDCEARLRGRKIDVDLQWATAPCGHLLRFDPAILWRGGQKLRLGDAEIPVLSLEANLLFLCAHGAKHGWSRLMWLGDIARAAQQGPDWERTIALAAEARCERPLLLGLLLARDFLDAEIPESLLTRARADTVVMNVAGVARRRLRQMPPQEPDGLALTKFNGALARNLWDKLRHYCALLRAPTEAELQTATLPRQLFFLYYPLRVMRLAAKHGARLLKRP